MHRKIKIICHAITKMPSKRYLAYVRSDAWKQRREEHLELCDRWCEICRAAPAIQAHHITYARLGYEQPGDLIAVCVRCHHQIHCNILQPTNDNQIPFQFMVKKKA